MTSTIGDKTNLWQELERLEDDEENNKIKKA